MNAMAEAMNKALKPPTRMQRVFNHVKAHPKATATAVAAALKLKASETSSLLSQMVRRGMARDEDIPMRVRSGRGFADMPIKHYSVTIKDYELLPMPKKPEKPAKKFADTTMPVTPPPPLKFADLPTHASVDDFIDRLSIRDARLLHQKLDAMFGGRK